MRHPFLSKDKCDILNLKRKVSEYIANIRKIMQ